MFIKIPKDIISYTAIGTILARQYYIGLVSEMGCCYKNATIKKHIILANQIAN